MSTFKSSVPGGTGCTQCGGEDADEVEVARAAVDVLLERRYEITKTAAPVS